MRDISLPRASLVPRSSLPATRLARLLLAALLAGSAPACMSWRVRSTPRPDAGARRYFELARVTAESGDMMVLHEVQVTQDSVFGWRRREVGGGLDEVRLARSQVRVFEARRFNAAGTVAVMAVGVAGLLAGLFYLSLATEHT
ncbi:MAG TPA: hypothetical protein VF746_10775 [Longimicrobium sp.]|jgi:hypothetical protein